MSLFDSVLAGKLAGGTGTSSWNDIKDKPFGETLSGGDTLTWDGNTEGLESFNMEVGGIHYKVSNVVLTSADFSADGTFSYTLSNGAAVSFTSSEILDGGGVIGHQSTYWVSLDASGAQTLGVSPGTYFCKSDADGFFITALTIPGYTGFPSVKTIDPKYLPMSDIIAAVKAAMEA